MSRGKKYQEKFKLVDREKKYPLSEAVALVKKTAYSKFDESIDLDFRLGINPKKTEQQVRGTVLLPEGVGKKIKILVFADGAKAEEARAAGADFVGGDELIKKVADGFLDFDKVLAVPELMPKIGKLGKILGQRGLMPNPKAGTVSAEVGNTVKEFKSGRLEFKSDKGGCLHVSVGKISFEDEKIKRNVKAAVKAILKAKPSGCKGVYLKAMAISSSMGPGIKLETSYEAS